MVGFAKVQHSIHPNWMDSGNRGRECCCTKRRGQEEGKDVKSREPLQDHASNIPKFKVTSPCAQHCCHIG